VRSCPVKAIRLVGGRSEVVQEKCVACGLCVTECSRGGHAVRDDTPVVLELLHSRRPVIALLASEFAPALHPMTVPQIERGLETLGFWTIETTLLGEEIVAEAYEQLHLREDTLLSIRSTCPVVVDFVRKYYPALVPALAPVVPPSIAQARLIRQVYDTDCAIVYVSPCYARKDEFRDPQFDGAVDAVIDFLELKGLLAGIDDAPVRGRATMASPQRPGVLKEISLTDGFPRQTLVARDLTDATVSIIRGLDDLDRLLGAVAAGEAGPAIVDALNCEGCIDGPAVSPCMSLFAKRNLEVAARQQPGITHVSTRAMLAVLPSVDTVRSMNATPVQIRVPSASELAEVLAAGRIEPGSEPDCGACGWPTCVEHAVAVYRAESSWDLCLPLQRKRYAEQGTELAEQRAAFEEALTLDPVTGLWNRRAFSERLAVEVARHLRYGSALSVVLIDLDDLGSVNTIAGRDGGTALVKSVADRIASTLRATDVAARWVGDQFAVILPGVGKTEAFAASEKLRTVIGEAPYRIAVGGYTGDVTMTASLGVATASVRLREGRALIEAADTALHGAMGAGRDRVHLAPG